ncbi:MAG: hypothetical protein QM504_07210 [Pseudomonadota bacterium]
MHNRLIRSLWIIPPIIIAVVIMLLLSKFKQPPQKVEQLERAVKSMVINVPRLAFAPKAIGYGTTRPDKTWEAVAKVSGQVIWVSDKFKTGHIIPAGTKLLKIDDTTYKLAITQIQALLNMLKVKRKTTQSAFQIDKRRHASLLKEVQRKKQLLQSGTVSSSEFDEAERNLLNSELTLQNHKNNLAINQAERELLTVQITQAELDLSDTTIISPLDVRLTDLQVDHYQYANKGQLLFSADSINKVEIEARFPIGKLRPLLVSKKQHNNEDSLVTEREPGAKKLKALVRLTTATHSIEWQATVDRVSGIVDFETQTIGVVVIIDKPYEQAYPGKRPPLIRNTFVEVELQKKGKGKSIIIPVSAIHNGKVYTVNQQHRLKIKKVKVMFIQANLAVIGKGLDEDEIIVVSNLVPAVEDMLLKPINDEKVLKRLKMEASGQNKRSKK